MDSDHGGTGTELSDIMESIEKQQFVNPVMLKEHFWNVFVVDAFLGNFDRHNGNWGFLYDPVSQNAEIAPVFDCGSCLLPQADETVMERVLRNANEMNARIFQFPTSAVKKQGRKRGSLSLQSAAHVLSDLYPGKMGKTSSARL